MAVDGGEVDAAPSIQTERLRLRTLDPADGPAFHHLLTLPEVRRYLLDGQVVSRAWVDDEIRASRDRFEAGSGGLWGIRLPDDERLIGFVGYRPFFDPPELQLLYALDPSVWGQGLATEAAAAAVRFGFARLGFTTVRAATDRPNEPSIAVLERLGMRRVEPAEARSGTLLFVLDRPARR